MSEKKNTESNPASKTENLWKRLLETLRHLLLHNGWMKAIAVLISVILWAGLVSQDETLTRDKVFQNVNVSMTGAETMRNNGYIVVSDLGELLKDVSITAAVPQKQYENAEASSYNVRVDLSRINGTGEQELKLQSTNSTTYGRVISTNPSTVSVMVEDFIVRQRIPVSVMVNGAVPEGWYMSTPSVDPALIAVSGPRSLVTTISRARAFINTDNIEWNEGTTVVSTEIKLYNRSGEEVNSNLLRTTTSSLTIDSVLIEYSLLPTRSFSTEDLVILSGNVADGYEIKEVRISPENVTVAAREEVLSQLEELPMDRIVNVKDLSETTVFQLKVQKPSDDSILYNDTVTVTAVIEAKEE